MVPISYIAVLILTSVLLFSQIFEISGKYKNLLIRLGLTTTTSVCWIYIILTSFELTHWFQILLIILFGMILCGFLTIITWKEPLDSKQQTPEEIKYTTEELIGVNGIVISSYGDGSFLCKLCDRVETQIVVYLDDCKINDMFIIEKIENGKIFGRKW